MPPGLISLLSSATPSGLLGLVILMMLFGWLLPLRIVRGRLADKDAVIEKQAILITTLRQNNAALLRGSNTTTQVLGSLPPVVGGQSDEVV